MLPQVVKRDGRTQEFDIEKIKQAVTKAFIEMSDDHPLGVSDVLLIEEISEKVFGRCSDSASVTVEDIQDMVEEAIMNTDRKDVARAYIRYRHKREMARRNPLDKEVLEIVNGTNDYWLGENSNKNPLLNTTVRDYMAGAISTNLARKILLDKDVVEAHDAGIIHVHDMDYYIQKENNCGLVNIKDMLQNGTVITETLIEKPHSFLVACNVTTQIIAQVASAQYGGQSVSLAHLAPFVDVSRQRIKKEVIEERKLNNERYDDKIISPIVDRRLRKEITAGIQTFQYQITTLMTCNGQAPFITLFMYLNEAENEQEKADLAMLIEEVLKQSIQGVKNEQGVWITPSFPKIIYVLQEDNITEDSKYWYLTQLAVKCSLKRLTPDYISEKVMKELKEGNCFPVMGCRSALSPWKNEKGEYQFYGRFNKGVVTLNLFDVALSSGGDMEKFWDILEDRCELCHKALLNRYENLKGTSSNVAPLLWNYGAYARLPKGETIDSLLVGGYSSISLGYAALYECVKYMTGKSHSEEGGKEFGLMVMQYLNGKCDQWNKQLYLGFGIYGTPIESVTYKFAEKVKERFGDDVFVKLDGADRDYITNSYHIPVFEEIDAFEKLEKEADFQALSNGGSISYVETPNLNDNVEAAIEVVKFIYDHNMYAELNVKSDYCQKCGYDKEIELTTDENGKYIWRCPNCGNTDVQAMDITRRTCGYKGTARNGWNQGRLDEMKHRVIHLDNIEEDFDV